ncbi:MAG: hypothetical protein ACSLFN_03800 [Candidatus Limnocylindrales bacterium]
MPDVRGVVDQVEVVEDQDRATDGDRWQLAKERLEHGLPGRPTDADLPEE